MLTIGDRIIAPDQPPYVIAEIGVNHDGSFDRACDLIDAAAEAHADAVKLQFFQADRLISAASRLAAYQSANGATDSQTLLRALELDADSMAQLIDRAHATGLHAIVTVFNLHLAPLAGAMAWDAFKTASTDLINRPLIESLMQCGRPLLVSTGASTIDEVRDAAGWLGSHPHLLFQCVSAYSTPDQCASLAARQAMEAIDPFALGYSDHTTAIDTGALAVCTGACALEKHLTSDRAAPGPDHAASLNPAQFADYVHLAHRAWLMRGQVEKRVLDIEQDVREVSRQSLVASRDLPAGHRLTLSDLEIKRPGTGLSPALRDAIVGRALASAVAADLPLMPEHLA